MPFSENFEAALIYATKLHRNQYRKGTSIPYISHLLAVSGLVMEAGGSEDEVIAALLHDAVEDQGGEKTRVEIEKRFGKNVAAIVKACSDTDVTPKPPWRERKEAYIEHLHHANKSVLLVSLADKLHNGRSILQDYRTEGEKLWDRFNATRDETLWYYRSLAEIFKEKMPSPLTDELGRIVSGLESLVDTSKSLPAGSGSDSTAAES